MAKQQTKNFGFTIIELMVTVMIAGIVAAFAIPSFFEMIRNNRAAALANSFVSSVQFAKSEAIKRGVAVTVCAASNTTQTACGTSANWTNGWLVFVDPDSDGVIASASDRLSAQEALTTGSTVTTAQARITFSPTGFVTAGANTFTLAATGCTTNHARLITVSNTGRIATATATCP